MEAATLHLRRGPYRSASAKARPIAVPLRGSDPLQEPEYVSKEYRLAVGDHAQALAEKQQVDAEVQGKLTELQCRQNYASRLAEQALGDPEGYKQVLRMRAEYARVQAQIDRAESQLAEWNTNHTPVQIAALMKERTRFCLEVERINQAVKDINAERQREVRRMVGIITSAPYAENSVALMRYDKSEKRRSCLAGQVRRMTSATARRRHLRALVPSDDTSALRERIRDLVDECGRRDTLRDQLDGKRQRHKVQRESFIRRIDELNTVLRYIGKEADVVDTEALRGEHVGGMVVHVRVMDGEANVRIGADERRLIPVGVESWNVANPRGMTLVVNGDELALAAAKPGEPRQVRVGDVFVQVHVDERGVKPFANFEPGGRGSPRVESTDPVEEHEWLVHVHVIEATGIAAVGDGVFVVIKVDDGPEGQTSCVMEPRWDEVMSPPLYTPDSGVLTAQLMAKVGQKEELLGSAQLALWQLPRGETVERVLDLAPGGGQLQLKLQIGRVGREPFSKGAADAPVVGNVVMKVLGAKGLPRGDVYVRMTLNGGGVQTSAPSSKAQWNESFAWHAEDVRISVLEVELVSKRGAKEAVLGQTSFSFAEWQIGGYAETELDMGGGKLLGVQVWLVAPEGA